MTITIATILAVCAGIVTISNALTAAVNWRNRFKEPEKLQNSRIEALENKVAELERGRLMNEQGIKKLEEDSKAFQKVMIKSLQALSEHTLDSSPETKKNLKDSVNALNDYLINNK